MKIVVSTVNRPQGYIHTTLSYLDKYEVILVCGEPDSSYLSSYRNKFKIIECEFEEYERISEIARNHHTPTNISNNPVVGIKAAWNYIRCLDAIDDVGLVLEDDVIFASGWFEFLISAIDELKNNHNDFLLSMFYPNVTICDIYEPFSKLLRESNEKYVKYLKNYFICCQGVAYVGKQAIASIKNTIVNECLQKRCAPVDIAIARNEDIPFFITTPSLVEHIGVETTGTSFKFFQSCNFNGGL